MKGFFTQGAALLTSSGIHLPELELLVSRRMTADGPRGAGAESRCSAGVAR